MKKKRKKTFAVTLIEIMVVILLIGVISGALAFNMAGSMDKGRAFKTEQNISRIKDILMMEYVQGDQSLSEVVKDWENVISRSPLVLKGGKELICDGWKETFKVALKGDTINVTSKKLDKYQQAHEKKK